MAQPRKPKGTPEGGRFAEKIRAEGNVVLEARRDGPDGPSEDIMVDFQDDPLGRGGWPRSKQGRPLVTNPHGARHTAGRLKGKIQKWAYHSASGAAIDSNPRNLDMWQERQTLAGFLQDRKLAEQARAELAEVSPLDTSAQDEILNRYAGLANEAAGTRRAADRGTFAHFISECTDKGESPIERLEEGAELGIDREAAERIATEWEACCEDYGFEMLDVEASIANDEYRVAGTTDRIMRLTKPLTYTRDKEQVTIPAGTVVIGDLKTGRAILKSGKPQYWGGYSAQLAGYAGGKPYNPVTGKRGTWPGGTRPSQDVAIIIHGDLEKIAKGSGNSFSIYPVSLAEGREYLRTSNDLRRTEREANQAVTRL